MKVPKRPARYAIPFLILALAACAVLIVFRSPLAPLLVGIPLPATTTPTTAALSTEPPSAGQLSPSASPAVITATPAGLCGFNTPMTILLTGTSDAQGVSSAESIRVVRINPVEPAVKVLAFPRDVSARTNVLQSASMPESRLGLAYSYKKQITAGTERQQTVAATTVLAQVLYDNFGVTPDHYITVDLSTWGQMIDAIGGVEVTLAEQVTLANGETLQAGTQRLNGRLAAAFIRFTDSGGEQDRLARQNLIARALHKQIRSGEIDINAGEFLARFHGAIVTDLSTQQMLSLDCLTGEITENNVQFFEIDSAMVTVGTEGALIPDEAAVRALVDRVLNQ